MTHLKRQVYTIWSFIQRENLHRLLYILIILVLVSAAAIAWLEPEVNMIGAFWWSIVTLTTVGYGDISPTTLGGRLIAIVIMFLGIGVLSMLSGTLASILVEKKIKEDRGMSFHNVANHIIMCEWNYRTRTILSEFRADPQLAEAPIILIADIDQKPVDDPNLFFIKGNVTEETVEKANLTQARTIVILGDDRLDDMARDAKVVLTTLTVESINPQAYTIVELVDESNAVHCQRARADEIIVGSELSSGLIARAALNHGISKFVTELLSATHGDQLYKLPIPAAMVGARFVEVLAETKQKNQCLVVAVQESATQEVVSNPPPDYQLQAGDYLIVIASEKPEL